MLAAAQDRIEESGLATAGADLSPQAAGVSWEEARCRDGAASMVGLFFSEDIEDIATAKGICAACPLATPCLQGALERGEPWGVWGGQLFADGKILAFKRRRGRPPKLVGPPQVESSQISAPARLTA
ncbi:MAG: WhiB family transcriptional regulator [Acidimicrobiales bacterium]